MALAQDCHGRPGREAAPEVPADLALTLSELVPSASPGLRHSQWLTSGPRVLVAIGDGSLHRVCDSMRGRGMSCLGEESCQVAE